MTNVKFDPDDIARYDQYGDAPVFVFCDHASNAVPEEMSCLGLPADILQTHIAWDIGAGDLSEMLAKDLGGALLRCCFSRLIVDANRDLTSGDLIPAVADQIPVPGNQMLTEDEREARIRRFHEPYHVRLGEAIEAFAGRHETPLLVSVHSFTNRLMGAGEERRWPYGLLWREDEPAARFMIDWLRENSNGPIGDNEPYDARLFNYSVDRHIGARGLRHVTLEIRQDLIGDPDGVEEAAALLARPIGLLLERL